MYEERREKFSFRSFFLTILLVLLFVFLMLWLFPTKWDVEKLQSTYDLERLSVLYDEVFANNVARMKDAAIESRTSSPVRIERDENFESNIKGIYPIGEGAGYAGGITTSAIDGLKIVENLLK